VPDVILRSPKPVVAAFLRAYYDCDGYAGKMGVILATASEELSKTVQLLLLNFGILSTRRLRQDGGWNVETFGKSAAVFYEQIGFGLSRKQEALRAYVENRQWFKREDWTDEIVAIERRRADVYDISVEETHRYAAQGFINHNSFWHSEIMTKKAMKDGEIVDFADHHSGVVATHPGRLNPYKLGLELLRDIEDRWNKGKFGKEYEECENIAEKRAWDRQLGLGRQKVFEVRKMYNDVTFIDAFLTPEFCLEQKLFSFRYNRDTDLYEIASREFMDIKQKLLFRLTNFGQPFIYVEDGNYNNRGELYLRHRHEGVDLKMDYARDTLRNIYKIWTRPAHLETVVDDKRRLITFDGKDFGERKLD
jgi:stage V sporulation protein R